MQSAVHNQERAVLCIKTKQGNLEGKISGRFARVASFSLLSFENRALEPK
jgi:hypothetical protein